ncbi:MAG: helix-turn-helix domain-containing protein [Dehalococcoidia bacterium]|jgi:excisionase family DNA binding protein|nr:helix-turn-helix domain-containing protein [Dehalococcoidia bacterium]
MPADEWLTLQEAADRLKVKVPTIRKYIRTGKLPAYRQANVVRVKPGDVDAVLTLDGRGRKQGA